MAVVVWWSQSTTTCIADITALANAKRNATAKCQCSNNDKHNASNQRYLLLVVGLG
jgi:hypothetical protein